MILTKTSTRTDKSSSSQERPISLSPNLTFRRTPFYFVTYGPFCNLIGLQYTLQREQLNVTAWEQGYLQGSHFPQKCIAVNGEVPFFVILALRVATVYTNYENAIKKLKT